MAFTSAASAALGGAATFELDLGPDTGAPVETRQYGRVSSQVETFSLTYDAGLSMVDGFTLTDEAELTWTGSPPSQSRLAFQIKVGFPAPTPASETTWGLIKLGNH